MTAPQVIWFEEELAYEGPECSCRFHGDRADGSDCPLHGESRESAEIEVREADEADCPF